MFKSLPPRAMWFMASTIIFTGSLVVSESPVNAVIVAHWNMNESPGDTVAIDIVGGVNGNLAGDAAFVPGGMFGNAVQMTRNNDGLLNMGSNFAFGNTFSFVAWVKTEPNFQAADTIIGGKHEAGSLNGYFLGMNTSAGYGQTNKAYFYISTNPGGEVISTTDVNDGQWHMIVGVLDNGNAHIYVDDGPAEDSLIGQNLAPGGNFAPFLIGGVNFGTLSSTYDGMIDDVRLYNHALSQQEIDDLYLGIPEPASLLLFATGALIFSRRSRSLKPAWIN